MEKLRQSQIFIENIIDGMYDWVRVLDLEGYVIFMNNAMSACLTNSRIGDMCYQSLGRSSPCDDCLSNKSHQNGQSNEKEEIINGRVFSVMSSPLKNQAGETIAFVEVMRDSTELKQLQQDMLKQNKELTDNMNIARKLQLNLLPKRVNDSRAAFTYLYKPCTALGGDFLDLFKIDSSHLGVYIADVSGHGVPASMLTVFLHSALDKSLLSPAHALKNLFDDFNKMAIDDDLYITVFYAVIDLEKKAITYSNAGHNATPILMTQKGIKALKLPGLPVSNWFLRTDYSDVTTDYSSGDKLLLFSDGIIEIRNKAGDSFGKKRLISRMKNDGNAIENMEKAVTDACSFGGIEQLDAIPDDITIALLELQ